MSNISLASQLGSILGGSLNDSNSYKDTFIGTEDVNSLNLVGIETINIVASVLIATSTYTTTGNLFVLDHATYGKLDNRRLTGTTPYVASSIFMFRVM